MSWLHCDLKEPEVGLKSADPALIVYLGRVWGASEASTRTSMLQCSLDVVNTLMVLVQPTIRPPFISSTILGVLGRGRISGYVEMSIISAYYVYLRVSSSLLAKTLLAGQFSGRIGMTSGHEFQVHLYAVRQT
jgi:hypothetical protein